MKIVQLSDLHLNRGERRYGVDAYKRLRICIDSINDLHADATLCVFLGDLAETGEREIYSELKAALDALRVPYRILVGNHDNRANLVSALSQCIVDQHGFVQSTYDAASVRLIFLDTLAEGRGAGELCDRRRAWLQERLETAEGRAVWIFMHHPPVKVGLPSLDRISLEEPGKFLEALHRHQNVKQIIFGHVHRSVAGSIEGIPFVGLRGLHGRLALDFHAVTATIEDAPPSYGIIMLDRSSGSVVVHDHDFLEQWPRYLSTTPELIEPPSLKASEPVITASPVSDEPEATSIAASRP